MKSVVIYFSKFGNTQMVAERIAETLTAAGPTRLVFSDDLRPEDFAGVELVVMGSPTHRMNLPEAVRPVFERLPRRILKGVCAAAFDTSYKMSPFLARFTAAPRLARRLRRLGARTVLPPETFHVIGREGPLYEGELERAHQWAQTILEKIEVREGGVRRARPA